MMSCDQQVYALGISNCWVCIFGGMDWEWGAHPSDRTCLTGFFRPPPLRQSLQNFRKFAIDWLQQRLRRLRAASGPCSCPPNPYTSDPIRSVAIRCDPATDFCPKKKGKRTKMFMHFFWSLTVLKVFRILRFSLVFAVPSLRCVNCMRTKIDEYARRRVAMGRGDRPSGRGGGKNCKGEGRTRPREEGSDKM